MIKVRRKKKSFDLFTTLISQGFFKKKIISQQDLECSSETK